MNKEEIITEINRIEELDFYLEMNDHWSSKDYEIDNAQGDSFGNCLLCAE